MSELNKPQQLRIRVTHDNSQWLDSIGAPALSRNDVATVLLEAAIRAVQANGGTYPTPLDFQIPRKHEAEQPPPKRKAA